MRSWALLPTLAVRTTGLPVELLARLQWEQTTAAIRDILACESQRRTLQRRLLAEIFPLSVQQAYTSQDRALLSKLTTWRRAVGKSRRIEQRDPIPAAYEDLQTNLNRWNELSDQLTTLIDHGRSCWQHELVDCRQSLQQSAADPSVQEAIFLSNPDMYAALQRYQGSEQPAERASATRKFERRLVFYLQRLCYKNETQSFFGPINYGRLDPTSPHNIHIRRTAAPLRRRETFPSQWMVETLADYISAEVELRPFLAPRRTTNCVLSDQQQLWFPMSGKVVALSPQLAQLFQLADGQHTVIALAKQLGEDWHSTWRRVEQLRQHQALVTAIIVPGDRSDPLAYLRQWLQNLPETLDMRANWLTHLDEFHGLLRSFASADLPTRVCLLTELESRFAEVCGHNARRGKGAMYADRMLCFEECLGDLEQCTLGGDLAQLITQQLQPILQLSAVYGRLLNKRDQRMAFALWMQLATDSDQEVPFLRYLHVGQRQRPATIAEPPDELDQFMATLHAHVRARSDDRRAFLRSDELPMPPLPAEPDACWYCSLDLLIAAPDQQALEAGTFQVVLGEVHPQPLTWVFPTGHFLGHCGEPLAESLRTMLCSQPGSAHAAQFVFPRKNKIYPYPLPGAAIELRPCYPDCRAIPLAAVQIRATQDRLHLWADNRSLQLYTPLKRRDDSLDLLAPFSFPAVRLPLIDFGDHTPRIQIDDVVYQRERWSVPGGMIGNPQAQGFDRFLEFWRWKDSLGLPDEIFVRVPQEPKPIYIDLTNYLLVELLDHLARQSERLIITEMLPNTQQLWLERSSGRYCCEFRAIAVGQHSEV
jgi:hypothetical protein